MNISSIVVTTLPKNLESVIENLKKSGLTAIHTFPYSIRKGTQADKRKDVLHKMIKVDISNVWGQITLSDLLAMEKEVAAFDGNAGVSVFVNHDCEHCRKRVCHDKYEFVPRRVRRS